MGRCVCRVCARIERICEKGSRNSQGPKGKQALVDRCGQRANGKSNRSCESNPQSREGQERRAGGAGAASAAPRQRRMRQGRMLCRRRARRGGLRRRKTRRGRTHRRARQNTGGYAAVASPCRRSRQIGRGLASFRAPPRPPIDSMKVNPLDFPNCL